MPLAADTFHFPSQAVIDYLLDQNQQESQLTDEKRKLKEGMLKLEDQLKLLDGRQDDQLCTISSGNVYLRSNVGNVRDALVGRLSQSMDLYLKANRQLLRLHREIHEEKTIVFRRSGVARSGVQEV